MKHGQQPVSLTLPEMQALALKGFRTGLGVGFGFGVILCILILYGYVGFSS